jgi:hypothetical protein
VPCGICTDDGRMINSAHPGGLPHLRGEAADLCRVWETVLKPKVFKCGLRFWTFRMVCRAISA